jgi:hypothetical protein
MAHSATARLIAHGHKAADAGARPGGGGGTAAGTATRQRRRRGSAGDVDDEAAGKPVNLLPAGIGSVPPTGSTSGRELAAGVMADGATNAAGTGQP